MVVKREDGLDVLPLPLTLGDARAAFISRLGDEEIDETESLGFSHGLVLNRSGDIATRAGDAHALQPILKARAVGLLGQQVV